MTEGNQWSETWFGVKRSTWMRRRVWIWRVCTCAYVHWIQRYSLWCLCASRWELAHRARFESRLLDGMERLDGEQVLRTGQENLLGLWLIKKTAVTWHHIHMPSQHSALTVKRKNKTCCQQVISLMCVWLIRLWEQHKDTGRKCTRARREDRTKKCGRHRTKKNEPTKKKGKIQP